MKEQKVRIFLESETDRRFIRDFSKLLQTTGISDVELRKDIMRDICTSREKAEAFRAAFQEILWKNPQVDTFVKEEIGIAKDAVEWFRKHILLKDFSEPHVLFNALRAFFASHFDSLDMTVYRVTEKSSLMLYVGDPNSRAKHIYPNPPNGRDYPNERAAMNSKSKGIFHQNKPEAFGANGAIRISTPMGKDYVFSFHDESHDGLSLERARRFSDVKEIWPQVFGKLQLIQSKYKDPLTDSYNRAYLEEVGTKKPYSILFLDIADFKRHNDQFGHAWWDTVLRQVADLLEASVKPDDKVCRFGWDEFVMLIDTDDESILKGIIERVESRLKAFNQEIQDTSRHVSASIWYSLYQEDTTLNQAIERADAYMYQKKNEDGKKWRAIRDTVELQEDGSKIEVIVSAIGTLERLTDEGRTKIIRAIEAKHD